MKSCTRQSVILRPHCPNLPPQSVWNSNQSRVMIVKDIEKWDNWKKKKVKFLHLWMVWVKKQQELKDKQWIQQNGKLKDKSIKWAIHLFLLCYFNFYGTLEDPHQCCVIGRIYGKEHVKFTMMNLQKGHLRKITNHKNLFFILC